MVSSASSKLKRLVEKLVAEGIITTKRVAEVMEKVDRAHFCPGVSGVYQDCPQSINYNVTISAPHMHAYCMEWMKEKLVPGARVLDVGCGSGYLCATFYELTVQNGSANVIGIEHIDELAQFSKENLKNAGYQPQMDNGSIKVVCGDGRQGYKEGAPYDAIHVGAAAYPVPQALIDQLATGGILVIPVGPDGGNQSIKLFTKLKDGKISEKDLCSVRYVPLTDKEKQLNRYF